MTKASHQSRGHFEIYVLCNKLIKCLGNALKDTESQVSLVKGTLIRESNIKQNISCIRGQTKLSIGETSPHDF